MSASSGFPRPKKQIQRVGKSLALNYSQEYMNVCVHGAMRRSGHPIQDVFPGILGMRREHTSDGTLDPGQTAY